MKKVFVPITTSLEELQKIILAVESCGLSKENTFVGGSFDKFAKDLKAGDSVVVYSLDVFNSINEMLAKTNELSERGIILTSICENWFNNPDISSREMIKELFLFGSRVHSLKRSASDVEQTHVRMAQSMIAKVQQAERLRTLHNVTVVKACKIAGCSLRTYYTYRKKI